MARKEILRGVAFALFLRPAERVLCGSLERFEEAQSSLRMSKHFCGFANEDIGIMQPLCSNKATAWLPGRTAQNRSKLF